MKRFYSRRYFQVDMTESEICHYKGKFYNHFRLEKDDQFMDITYEEIADLISLLQEMMEDNKNG